MRESHCAMRIMPSLSVTATSSLKDPVSDALTLLPYDGASLLKWA
jgi:hypothetical protein